MGAAWVLDARQLVGPEGSRLWMEGLLRVGGPCAMAWVRGLAGWPGLVGRGRIRKDSGTPKVWVVTGHLPLEGLCADGRWGWGASGRHCPWGLEPVGLASCTAWGRVRRPGFVAWPAGQDSLGGARSGRAFPGGWCEGDRRLRSALCWEWPHPETVGRGLGGLRSPPSPILSPRPRWRVTHVQAPSRPGHAPWSCLGKAVPESSPSRRTLPKGANVRTGLGSPHLQLRGGCPGRGLHPGGSPQQSPWNPSLLAPSQAQEAMGPMRQKLLELATNLLPESSTLHPSQLMHRVTSGGVPGMWMRTFGVSL